MNKIVKNGEVYTLILENGEEFLCTKIYEKKSENWYVKLPKDNPTGRTYVVENHFKNTDIYEFENKTEHREGLSSGGWKAKMTDEEKKIVEDCENTIERIKKICMERKTVKPDKNSIEYLEAEKAKIEARIAKMRAEK